MRSCIETSPLPFFPGAPALFPICQPSPCHLHGLQPAGLALNQSGNATPIPCIPQQQETQAPYLTIPMGVTIKAQGAGERKG